MGLRGEGEAADKTDVPGDDRDQKKRRGLPRGVRPLQNKFGPGREHGRLCEKGVKTPAYNLGDGRRGLRVPERERGVIMVRGKNREGGSDGEVGMVWENKERWR